MTAHGPRYLVKGDISPSRFVKIGSADYGVVQASAAADKVVGISQQGSRLPPSGLGSDGLAGHDPATGPFGQETMRVFGEGEQTLLEIGAGGCTRGDYLRADASGKGVTVAFTETSLLFYGAMALESASAGEFAN